MDKDEFLLLIDRLRSQYEKDLSSADVDDEDLWAATLQLLTLVFGNPSLCNAGCSIPSADATRPKTSLSGVPMSYGII